MPTQKHKYKETVAQVRAAHLWLAVFSLRSCSVSTDTGKTLDSEQRFEVLEK